MTTTPARAVTTETISQYTEDIEQAGTTYATGVLGLLFATIDTYLIGDSATRAR